MLSRIKALVFNLLNSGIGSDDPRSHDRSLMRRIQLLNGYGLFQVVLVLPVITALIVMHLWIQTLPQILLGVLGLWGLVEIRKGGSVSRVGRAQVTALFITTSVGLLYTGGMSSPITPACAMMVAYAGIVLSTRAVIVCALGYSVVFTLIMALTHWQLMPNNEFAND